MPMNTFSKQKKAPLVPARGIYAFSSGGYNIAIPYFRMNRFRDHTPKLKHRLFRTLLRHESEFKQSLYNLFSGQIHNPASRPCRHCAWKFSFWEISPQKFKHPGNPGSVTSMLSPKKQILSPFLINQVIPSA